MPTAGRFEVISPPDQTVSLPPGTDNTVVKITFVPLDPTIPIEVKISTKICVKETSEFKHEIITFLHMF